MREFSIHVVGGTQGKQLPQTSHPLNKKQNYDNKLNRLAVTFSFLLIY